MSAKTLVCIQTVNIGFYFWVETVLFHISYKFTVVMYWFHMNQVTQTYSNFTKFNGLRLFLSDPIKHFKYFSDRIRLFSFICFVHLIRLQEVSLFSFPSCLKTQMIFHFNSLLHPLSPKACSECWKLDHINPT